MTWLIQQKFLVSLRRTQDKGYSRVKNRRRGGISEGDGRGDGSKVALVGISKSDCGEGRLFWTPK